MIKTGMELAAACKNVAENYDTLYVYGSFGWLMDAGGKQRAYDRQAFNRREDRLEKIKKADGRTFGFDCSGLIKGLLWGWEGQMDHVYGGAKYASNEVNDLSADALFGVCRAQSADFGDIEPGEVLWREGHIGVYIGDGLAVECTYRWNDGVQITAVHNMGKRAGYQGREWSKHAKLPYLDYEGEGDYDLKLRNLRRGCKGEDVRAMQILLSGRGYNDTMLTPDGIFGPRTQAAVCIYQRAAGLTVDGIAGRMTMASLMGVSDDE